MSCFFLFFLLLLLTWVLALTFPHPPSKIKRHFPVKTAWIQIGNTCVICWAVDFRRKKERLTKKRVIPASGVGFLHWRTHSETIMIGFAILSRKDRRVEKLREGSPMYTVFSFLHRFGKGSIIPGIPSVCVCVHARNKVKLLNKRDVRLEQEGRLWIYIYVFSLFAHVRLLMKVDEKNLWSFLFVCLSSVLEKRRAKLQC